MLSIPKEFKALVSDYKMHLLQLRDSEVLHFCDPDVHTVFEISRRIYQRDYRGIELLYQHRNLSTEVGLVIGAITNSQQLIDYSLRSEREGGGLNMCTALEELRKEGIEEGREKGIKEGIKEGEVKGAIRTCRQVGLNQDSTLELLAREFALSGEKAAASMEKYW